MWGKGKKMKKSWEIVREKEIGELLRRVNEPVNKRNACMYVINSRKRLRVTERVTGMRDSKSLDAERRLENPRTEVRIPRDETVYRENIDYVVVQAD